MAIYYTIESSDVDSTERFETKEGVCMTIRSKKLKCYKVFEKNDFQIKAKKIGPAIIFPLSPYCKDITSEIKEMLGNHEKSDEHSDKTPQRTFLCYLIKRILHRRDT